MHTSVSVMQHGRLMSSSHAEETRIMRAWPMVREWREKERDNDHGSDSDSDSDAAARARGARVEKKNES